VLQERVQRQSLPSLSSSVEHQQLLVFFGEAFVMKSIMSEIE
jgi:hypothetical protein